MGRKKHKTKNLVSASPHARQAAATAQDDGGRRVLELPKPLTGGWLYAAIAALVLATLWAYWPTFVWMEDQWRNQPDYSHGYLIVPLALGLMYHRRDAFPGISGSVGWLGFLLLGLAVAVRALGRIAYMDFLDGWTLVLWVSGIIWVLCGWRVVVWALPAVFFLILMTPLPFQAESLLSNQLQSLATKVSVVALQTIGLPAVSEGHTIWLNDQQMLVEEACSGLRIFVGMGAMGYVFATLARRAWVDKWVILVSALPIAIAVNVFRVVGTVLGYHWLSVENAKLLHDFLGIVMIVLGALMLAGVKRYWESLYRPLDSSLNLRQLAVDI